MKDLYKEDFCEFVKKALWERNQQILNEFNKRKCPDIVVGESGVFWFDRKERKKHKDKLEVELSNKKSKEKRIVIVLESPHKDEFMNAKNRSDFFDENICSNPALGRSGTNLQKYFNDEIVRKKLQVHGKYRVILMNSIQYQCSLGQSEGGYRDYIWLKYWYQEKGKECFIERLRDYKPDIIVNLCTKGNCKKNNIIKWVGRDTYEKLKLNKCELSLREIVSAQIEEKLKGKIIYEGNHPCSWKTQNDIDNISLRG